MNLSFSKMDMATLVAPMEEVAVARDLDEGSRSDAALSEREKTMMLN